MWLSSLKCLSERAIGADVVKRRLRLASLVHGPLVNLARALCVTERVVVSVAIGGGNVGACTCGSRDVAQRVLRSSTALPSTLRT